MSRTTRTKVIESDNNKLRAEIEQMKSDHRSQIAAKNRSIDQARSERNAELVSLMAAYHNLRPLLAALVRAIDLADPVRSTTPNVSTTLGVRLGDDGHPEDPYLSSDGISTRQGRETNSDRNRIERFDRWLRELAERCDRDMSPREFEADRSGSPQCWQDDCEARAEFQSADLEACRSCGTTFGAYKPVDFTKPPAPARRCWTKNCRRRGRKILGPHCSECGSVGTERK